MATEAVVHRALTARIGTPTQNEESRAFLQERIALFGKITFIISSTFFVILECVELSRPEGWRSVTSLSHLGHAFLSSLLGGVWLLARRGKLSAKSLPLLDGLTTIVMGAGFGILVLLLPRHPGTIFPMILAMTHVAIARAVIVPSMWWHTLVTSLVAFLPLDVTTYLVAKDAVRMLPDPTMAPFLLTAGVTWCTSAAVIATVTSRVIYGLQRKVDEAKQLGQYTLADRIAEGGMGVVYRAHHAMLRRPTAVKLLRPEDAGEANLARFEREVQLTSGLTHPNTVAIYDYGRTPEGVFYYAMEYLDGVNLEDLVTQDGPQPPARVIHLLRQICGALGEAHGVGLIHRDVKPANVILCERGGVPDVVKVVDFGLVKDIAANEALTHADTLTGTPLYLAPEAIKSPASARASGDLYAVGAVGYFLLTGKNVFEGGSILEVCSHHLHTTPVPPSQRLGRPVPDDLESLILSCLEKDPAARPESARALDEALSHCSDSARWSESEAVAWWKTHRSAIRTNGEVDALAATVAPVPGVSGTMQIDLARRVG